MDVARVHHKIITTLDELFDPLASARMQPKVVQSGPMRAEVMHFNASGTLVEVGDYSFPVTTQGESSEGRVTFVTPLRPSTVRLNGERLSPAALYAFGEGSEVRGATADATCLGIVSMPTAALERTAISLGVDVDLPDRGELKPVRTIEQRRLHQLFGWALESARATPGGVLDRHAAGSISDTMAEIVVRSFERDAATRPRARRTLDSMGIARACEEFAETTRYQDVTLAKLCTASGYGERRVREAFYECYGMSPTACLRVAALYRVRAAMLERRPTRATVSGAAADFGFWHLGRFSAQYRALFGESPRETLAGRSTSQRGLIGADAGWHADPLGATRTRK